MLVPRPLGRALLRAGRAFFRPETPLLTQLVVTRRCNLTCGYCNEYDDFSPPIDVAVLERRIDHVASLGTVLLTLTGGEPLLHPQLDRLIARSVSRGMVTTTISNAYAMTRSWIERLNHAGLTLVQISIDNLEPNDQSQKSWSQLRRPLELLRDHARFAVSVNAVLGSCPPDEIRLLVKEVAELGFYMTVGLMHDGQGQLERGLVGDQLELLYHEMKKRSRKSSFHLVGEGWETRMLKDGQVPWKCRAGSRYLYVDEDGVVSYCSQRRGDPGTPILEYGADELRQAFRSEKDCAPSCTLACVRRASALDGWRGQTEPDRPALRAGVNGRLPILP